MYYNASRDPNSPRNIARQRLMEECEEEVEGMVEDFRGLLGESGSEILDTLVAEATNHLFDRRLDDDPYDGPDTPEEAKGEV